MLDKGLLTLFPYFILRLLLIGFVRFKYETDIEAVKILFRLIYITVMKFEAVRTLHKSPPFDPGRRQMKLVHTLTPNLLQS